MLRIAYICSDPGVPVFGSKGASVHVREMVAAFEALGHDVVLFCANTGAAVGTTHKIKIVPATRGRLGRRLGSVSQKFDKATKHCVGELERLALNLKFSQLINNYSREGPFDIVYERYSLFHFAGVAAAHKLGLPHLLEVNAPLCYEEEHMRNGIRFRRLAGRIERAVLKNTDHILAVSEVLQSFAIGMGAAPERITVLPNGVTAKQFCLHPGIRDAIRLHLGLQQKIVVGFVGGLRPWHGTALLLDAFADLVHDDKRLHLLIVGDGPQRKVLENRINAADLGDKVTLTGIVPHEEVPGYIAAMDIAVAPYERLEYFYFSPMKVFEYLAAGTPVIAARIGQLENIVRDGESGLLVDAGDVAALREALRRLAADSELRARMGGAGRDWVLHERTWEHNAKLVAEIAIASSAVNKAIRR